MNQKQTTCLEELVKNKRPSLSKVEALFNPRLAFFQEAQASVAVTSLMPP